MCVGSQDGVLYDGRTERKAADSPILLVGSGVLSPWLGIGESAVYDASFVSNRMQSAVFLRNVVCEHRMDVASALRVRDDIPRALAEAGRSKDGRAAV